MRHRASAIPHPNNDPKGEAACVWPASVPPLSSFATVHRTAGSHHLVSVRYHPPRPCSGRSHGPEGAGGERWGSQGVVLLSRSGAQQHLASAVGFQGREGHEESALWQHS